jgi:hypothetical protein
MPLNYPDILKHNNPNLGIADTATLKGGVLTFGTLTDFTTFMNSNSEISSSLGVLKENATMCKIVGDKNLYLLTTLANANNLTTGWQKLGGAGIAPYLKGTAYSAGDFVWFNPNGLGIHIFEVVADYTSPNGASDVVQLLADAQSGAILWVSGCDSAFVLGGNYAKGMWLNNNLTIYKANQSYTNNGTNTFNTDKTTYWDLVTVEFIEKYVSVYQLDSDGNSLSNSAFVSGVTSLKLGLKDQESFDEKYQYMCYLSYDSVNNIPAKWIRIPIENRNVYLGEGITSGSGTAYTLTTVNSVSFTDAYTNFQQLTLTFHTANTTTTPTININGLGAETITNADGVALTMSQITTGKRCIISRNAPNDWRILN